MPRATVRPVRKEGRVLLVVGFVAALLVLVMGALLRGQVGDTAVDVLLGTQVIELFVGHRTIVVILAELGGPESIVPLALLWAVVLAARQRWADAALVVLAPALAGGLSQYLLKPLVDRPLGGVPAWPSGHATGTWALATVALVLLARGRTTRVRRWLVVAVLAVASVNAVGLVGAQYHFATDVVGGAAVGVAVTCLLAVGLSDARPVRSAQRAR